MSVAAAPDLPRVFRDDGPAARALGRLLGPLIPAPGREEAVTFAFRPVEER